MPEPQQILPRSTPIIDVVFASTKPQYACWGSFCVKPAARTGSLPHLVPGCSSSHLRLPRLNRRSYRTSVYPPQPVSLVNRHDRHEQPSFN
ncbi:hypothetical protein F3I27_12865 [Pantoea sp. Bo_2]|nr:hypothetical protein F3I57_18800 [Pantoea sp. VH_3]KAA5948578.1 hypothetical protein F3I56_19390 [Pantoea sp. VH_25]KAA5955466.1 hypothetical protein F3I55_12905 [Pantoea sp. VH_24]KAA5958913.1 hypothetical protein F3I53_13345 [Pantoea sp. VH_16]KAA5964111.1 hypothetical protein F3I54_13185 [Pantoea sp. VH_18]KAA5981798.1 hypothetical protein F3I48_13285 [Pantoea sp. M_3]KAA5992979.1 hypothetical protein F3I46_19985 [Pantoea sp. M_1]KAA6002377.1 hypothetical protein F3I45_11710 [Pantoea s